MLPIGCVSTSVTCGLVHRVCNQLLEEIPAAWSSLYRQFQGWRSRVASDDFSVVDGLIFLQQPGGLRDPEMLLRLFHFMAEHGLKLSTTTEYKVEQALPALAATPPRGAELWLYLQETLLTAARRRRSARHERAAIAGIAPARIERDRSARRPRFLPSLHGG